MRSALTTEWRNVITTGSLNTFFVSGRRLTDAMAEFTDWRSKVLWSFSFLEIKENVSCFAALSCSTHTLYEAPQCVPFEQDLSSRFWSTVVLFITLYKIVLTVKSMIKPLFVTRLSVSNKAATFFHRAVQVTCPVWGYSVKSMLSSSTVRFNSPQRWHCKSSNKHSTMWVYLFSPLGVNREPRVLYETSVAILGLEAVKWIDFIEYELCH